MTKRKKIHANVQAQVVLLSRRRCALCFGLYADAEVKRGQIAHVDRDATNDADANLAFLCLPHHDEYDARPSQSKGFTPEELLRYRSALYAFIEHHPSLSWPNVETPSHMKRKDRTLTVELYDRRMRIYHLAKDLIASVIATGAADIEAVRKFSVDTEEGLFLFDRSVAEFLAELYKQGIMLALLTQMLKPEPLGERRVQLVTKQGEVALWFNEQFSELRSKMAPFLTFA